MAVLNLRKTMMAISLNAKLKSLVTNVELSQATILVVAQLKMPLLAHVRIEAITQESANLPIEFGLSEDDVSVITIGETVS